MKCTVLGIQNIDYVNKTGKHVVGLKLFVSYVDSHVDGRACLDVYISGEVQISPSVGDDIILFYNRFGRCVGFDFAG